ncbi:MAG: hypothetical protein LUE17_12585 [Planctomycetaceae bacterium]|nr:hypothetical protein [Planctomycetaceae bacterium]
MAEEQDSRNSRFLFSDLDVSDKGRPSRNAAPAAAAEPAASAFATPLTSIAELASSLEFGFEDDFDDADFKAGVADAEEAARPVYRQSGFLAGEDPELDLLAERLTAREIYQPAFPELAPDGSASVPTWEEFTQAYDLVREPGETDAQFAARRWREARRRRRARLESEFAVDSEKAGDPLMDTQVDILSVVDPDEWRYLDETPPEPAEHAAVEEEEDNPAATQVINPRERLAALELAAREAEAEARRLAELGPEPEAEPPGPTVTETEDYLPNPNPTDTLHEMFSDVDLEALWREQVEKRNRARSSGRHGKADSRVVDLFDEVDLEAAWDERKKAGLREGTVRFPELAIGETLVLEPGLLDSSQTAVMNPEDMPAFPPVPPAAEEPAPADAARPSDSVMSRYRLASGEGATLEQDIGYAAEDGAAPGDAVSEEEAFDDLQSLLEPEDAVGGDAREVGEGAAVSHDFVSGIYAPTITTDDVINTISLDDEPINADVSAPVIDDSAITSVRGPRPGTEEMMAIMGEYDGQAGADGAEEGEAVAVDPMDVFANMDGVDFDFSDDMDDEMRAMLDDEGEALDEDAEGAAEETAPSPDDIPPDGRVAKLVWRIRRYAKRYMPEKAVRILEQLQGAIAWKENWWFYCDLLAAIIASASLAVIISYYIWYR